MADVVLGDFSLERMVRAVEKVRDRLLRAARALDDAGVPYAIAGGNAVAAWVSRVDEAAVRNTLAAPEVAESERGPEPYQVLTLAALVRMKLTSFRDKDRTHLRDMLEVKLIDASWKERLPAELADRLQELLDNPDG